MASLIESRLPPGKRGGSPPHALSILSLIVGALQLARIMPDAGASGRILASALEKACLLLKNPPYEYPIAPPEPAVSAPFLPGPRAASRVGKSPSAGALVLAATGALGLYLVHTAHHEETDDAYTRATSHAISSRVAGTVLEVTVDDNDAVPRKARR